MDRHASGTCLASLNNWRAQPGEVPHLGCQHLQLRTFVSSPSALALGGRPLFLGSGFSFSSVFSSFFSASAHKHMSRSLMQNPPT